VLGGKRGKSRKARPVVGVSKKRGKKNQRKLTGVVKIKEKKEGGLKKRSDTKTPEPQNGEVTY